MIPGIRSFVETDRRALREIYLAARRQTFHWLDTGGFHLNDFDRDTEGELIWVALRDGRPVGFVSVWAPDDFIHCLFVHPDVTGHGIGSALLDHCLARTGRPATLKCMADNARARDFYLARGWRVAAEDIGPDGPYLLMRFVDGGELPGS